MRFGRLWLSLLFAMAGLGLAVGANSERPVDLKLEGLRGGSVRLRDYRDKIVVLNFWATWCGPCKAEMPMLVAAEKQYKERGVVFIGVSLDDDSTAGRIPGFLSKYDVTFPVWTGATADHLAKLRMGEAVPATAFLDRGGVVVSRISGQLREQELKDRIEWLLGDRSTAAPTEFVSHFEK